MGVSQGRSSHCVETHNAAAHCCARSHCCQLCICSSAWFGLACIEALLCCLLSSASTPDAQHWAWRRLTAELMMEEIGRRPTTTDSAGAQNGSVSHPDNREGYAWAAAMGLGLITLGRGRSAAGLADMRIEQRLRQAQTTLTAVHGMIAAPPQHITYALLAAWRLQTHKGRSQQI